MGEYPGLVNRLTVLDKYMKKIIALSLLAGLLLSPLAVANAVTLNPTKASDANTKPNAKSVSHIKQTPKSPKVAKAPKNGKGVKRVKKSHPAPPLKPLGKPAPVVPN
jgi:hypothetical protein